MMTDTKVRMKRAIYVVLLCIAIAMSTFAVYNQLTSDSNVRVLADQVTQACADNRALAESQGLNCTQAQDIKQDPAVLQGQKGDKGEQGDPGIQGPQGVQGIQGLKGDTGTAGSNGSDGISGAGTQGPQGTPGAVGAKGDKGDTGAQGPQGDRGSDGQPAPHISSMKFVGNAFECSFVVTFTDDTSESIAVGGALCT